LRSLPLFVMDWIDGPNLDKAVKSKAIDSWEMILKVSYQLTKVIEGAHKVPERVLHRDLRPPNIMLKDYYTEPEGWKVVVLDFDLSWHLGAFREIDLEPWRVVWVSRARTTTTKFQRFYKACCC